MVMSPRPNPRTLPPASPRAASTPHPLSLRCPSPSPVPAPLPSGCHRLRLATLGFGIELTSYQVPKAERPVRICKESIQGDARDRLVASMLAEGLLDVLFQILVSLLQRLIHLHADHFLPVGRASEISSSDTKAPRLIRKWPNSSGEAPGRWRTRVVTRASEQALSAGSITVNFSSRP